MSRELSIFDKNMKAWEKKFGGGEKEIRRKREELQSKKKKVSIKEERSLDEMTILKVEKEKREVYLGGIRDCMGPVKAWSESYGELQPSTTMFIVGLGNPYYFKEACNKFEEQIRILVYEPSLEIFLYVMEHFDFTKELKSKRAIIFIIDGINDYAIDGVVLHLININMLPDFKMYVLPNYRGLFTEKIKKFSDSVFHQCDAERVGLNTTLRFAGISAINLLSNVKYVAKGIKSKQFCDYIPRDIPAIVVAAGPSLDKNIKELKKAKGKAFIIACDTAIKPLLREGIRPDMFVLVDGRKPLHLIEIEGAETIPLLACVTATREFFEFHKGRKIFFNEFEPLVNHLFEMNDVSFETVPCGGSVATSAFAFAYMIGLKTIILVGQDLALQGDKTHAAGTIDDDKDFGSRIKVEGNYDKEVFTREDFKIYLEWYNWYIQGVLDSGEELRVINATEGGARIKNTEIMTLKEAIEETCTQEIDIESIISDMPGVFNKEQQEKINQYFQGIPGEFREIQENAEKLKELYQKLDEICSKQKLNVDVYKKTLKKIKNLTKKTESHRECMSLISESLKVADFILKSEQNLKQQKPKDEGKEIARQGLIYTDMLIECAGMFADYSEEVFK